MDESVRAAAKPATGRPERSSLQGSAQRSGDGSTPSAGHLIAYSLPVCALVFLWIPTVSILPGLYGKYFGLSLTQVAGVLLATRLIDAAVDPLVGYFSDRHRIAGGSRKVWMITGGVLLSFSSYFLFAPDGTVPQSYYLMWSLCFYFAWSLIDIPHYAWGAELTGDNYGRARVYGYRGTSVYIGLIVFYSLPFLPMFGSAEYTPQTLRGAVLIGAIFMLVTLSVSACVAPGGTIPRTRAGDSFKEIFASVVHNKPLLHFVATYFCFGTSYGMWTGLLFIYLDGYLGLGGKTAVIFLTFALAGVASIPLWVKWVAGRGKGEVLAYGILLYAASLFSYLLIKPSVGWWAALIASCGAYVGVASFTLVSPALLADVVDYGALKFSKNRASTYFAFLTLAFKATSGFGAGLSLAMAGYFGFRAGDNPHGARAVLGLNLGFVVLPLALAFSGFVLALKTPITKKRHDVIRQRLDRRARADQDRTTKDRTRLSPPVPPAAMSEGVGQ